MQTTDTNKFVASAIVSELQSSDMYMTVKARLFDLRANLNKVRVTEAFMDEIVSNEDKYVCIPLCADVRGLLSNRTIGHMYDAKTGQFHSTQIGAFYKFQKETDGDNAYLVGYVRIMKRNKAICHALSALFADNALKFSFEITCASYTVDGEETIIDVDPKNFLQGMAVVTFPACEEATAQQLVAECLGKGDENMADINEIISETENVEVVAENEIKEVTETEVVAEQTVAEQAAVEQVAEVEAAERVIVEQTNVQVDTVSVYNCDTGQSVEQRTETITRSCTPMEIAEEVNEDQEAMEPEEQKEEIEEQNAACKKKECAEEDSVLKNALAEILAKIDELQTKIAELETKPQPVVASANEDNEQIVAEQQVVNVVNPFIAQMETPSKYSLLDKREKKTNYSLLERV